MTLLFGPIQLGDDFVTARCALSWQPPGQPITAARPIGYLERVDMPDGSASYRWSRPICAASTRKGLMDHVYMVCQEQDMTECELPPPT
jgi:hypothetical protein